MTGATAAEAKAEAAMARAAAAAEAARSAAAAAQVEADAAAQARAEADAAAAKEAEQTLALERVRRERLAKANVQAALLFPSASDSVSEVDALKAELATLKAESAREINALRAEVDQLKGAKVAMASGGKDQSLRQRSLGAVAAACPELLGRATSCARKGQEVSSELLGQIWDEYDTNRDGKLSVEELTPVVQHVLSSQKSEIETATAEMRSELAAATADPGSRMMVPIISMMLAEVAKEIEQAIVDPKKVAMRFFEDLESNKDGVVTKDEWIRNGSNISPATDIAADLQAAMDGKGADFGADDDCCIM